jgi:hypothetical protein
MNCARKLCTLILILAVAAALQARTNADALQTVVKVEPYQNVVGINDQFGVNVTIVDVEDLFGLETRLYWNASVLQLDSTEVLVGVESHPEGVLYNGSEAVWVNETFGSGEYMLNAMSVGEQTPSFNGSGTLAMLTFNVVGIGSCELTLQTALYDKASSQIDHSTENGYYSLIYLSAFPANVTVGGTVNINGYVESVTENVNVTIQYFPEDGINWMPLQNVTTDSQGNYGMTWTPRVGTHQIMAVATIQNIEIESAVVSVSAKAQSASWFMYLLVAVPFILMLIALLILYRKRRR